MYLHEKLDENNSNQLWFADAVASSSGVKFGFVLLRFRLYAFIEAAAFCSIVLRHAGVPIATQVFFSFVYFEMSLFPFLYIYIFIYLEMSLFRFSFFVFFLIFHFHFLFVWSVRRTFLLIEWCFSAS